MYIKTEIDQPDAVSPPRAEYAVTEPKRSIEDNRFRRLMGDANWARLPTAIRRRFGKRVKRGASVVYQGEVTEMRMSRAGRLLASMARAIGAPLPYDPRSVGRAAVVVVTEDPATNGQFWIRQYGRANGFPQTVCSSKRFEGPTGLEEYIGYGIGMSLRLEASPRALFFLSSRYFVTLFGRRLTIPPWMSPGQIIIGHEEIDDNAFRFSLTLEHPALGTMIHQSAVFKDAVMT